MERSLVLILTTLLLATPTLQQNFAIGTVQGPGGLPLTQTTCNVQTTLEFKFNSSSATSGWPTAGTIINQQYSNFTFLDRFGNDLFLNLNGFGFDNSSATTGYVTGYTGTVAAAAVFQFVSGGNNVYVYIPFTSTADTTAADVVDLTSSKAPSNALGSWDGNGALSAFNFLDTTDYNQWYSMTSGTTNTVLVSKFIYKINSIANASPAQSTVSTSMTGLTLDTTTADKLCYASTSQGNFQTQFRDVPALWFIWIGIFIYWAMYLFTEPTTKSVFDHNKYTQNIFTAWSLYSIVNLAHEEFFTKLSRLTVVLIQWSIQGVFIAAMISRAYSTGISVIIWTPLVAYAVTFYFPFIWGNVFFKKIYRKYLMKYHTIKKIMESTDKEKNKEYEGHINTYDEKIFGYYHWFYCVVFMLFWVCWPVTISLMQTLSRLQYDYNYYWLAAMGIMFVLQYLIFEPIMIAILRNTDLIKYRGGFYYDIRLGQSFRQVNQQ